MADILPKQFTSHLLRSHTPLGPGRPILSTSVKAGISPAQQKGLMKCSTPLLLRLLKGCREDLASIPLFIFLSFPAEMNAMSFQL